MPTFQLDAAFDLDPASVRVVFPQDLLHRDPDGVWRAIDGLLQE